MRLHLIFIIFFLFITGCASQKPSLTVPHPDWKSRLEQQTEWQVAGKLAFISPEKRQSVNFNWHNQATSSKLALTTFIGSHVLTLEQFDDHATLLMKGETHSAQNAQQLLYQLTGMMLPIDNAPNWLKGVQHQSNSEFDQLGRATKGSVINQFGQIWHIDYQHFQLVNGLWVPDKLTLSHQTIKVKIQIYSWQFKS
ncbi:outer membrane lipoprotein LolB [Pseudoalteromonas ulvae UL12]|uniref:Outer-membrane lipoprotein LolB n=1 Tax=Pseudoalteromonas ulvae TaxID=107327 RepID=A0A244CVF9_PSEDV|nr:lipoprotein insertase outer membrane protein LolB [Pseudoalteromonas ulvae]MBE0362492.1 outer membrane lipoprotein LolB [Pseudoalteromonas ulvae UL12]OUL59544.1 outer membrane lipoprotein LolB [Pseudoalteromonas ulvae]